MGLDRHSGRCTLHAKHLTHHNVPLHPYSQHPLMYHPHARTAMQENVGYKRARRDQK